MAGRPRIADSVLDLIGNTPLVRLNRLPGTGSATVLAKGGVPEPRRECQGPHRTLDDRGRGAAGRAAGGLDARRADQQEHRDRPGAGGGSEGLPPDPDDAGRHESRAPAAPGAPGSRAGPDAGHRGDDGAVFAAQELCRTNPGYVMLQQFENPANPDAHRRTTALEILEATGSKLDAFVAGVGTEARSLVWARCCDSACRAHAWSPSSRRSPVLSGERRASMGSRNRRVVRAGHPQPRGDRRGRPGQGRGRDGDRAPSGSGGRAPRGDLRRGQRVGGPRGG